MALYDSTGKLVLPIRSRIGDTPGAAYQVDALDAMMPNLLPGRPATAHASSATWLVTSQLPSGTGRTWRPSR